MPNWCRNELTVSHRDAARVTAIMDIVNAKGELFQFLLPCPQELLELGNKPASESKKTRLDKKYGAHDAQDWCEENWGTKWDVQWSDTDAHPTVKDKKGAITFAFDTAWTPPTALMKKMKEQGYVTKLYYYESDMMFCGMCINGKVSEWEGDEITLDGLKNDRKLRKIDKIFEISDDLEQNNDDDADDDH